ncbi:short-chain collagen C4-like [Mya arenaria]|uniref:short-chain collagen C4-like n=1 Tax=Mya arenaria TaxID=6604 RepID=UPI0022E6B04F|nr:short-chain collagen C4-like [Mya arenaria]
MLLDNAEELAQDVADLKTLVAQQGHEIQSLRAELAKGTGSSFIRWGRTSCEGNGSDLVYSGYMAGTFVDKTKYSGDHDGANYLCLSDNPTWSHYSDNADNIIYLTGVEYSFNPHQTSDIISFFGSNVFGQQVPCAACKVSRGVTMMIPGRNTCNSGWTKEYSGYIVGPFAGYSHGSEYICLDDRPEGVVGSTHFDGTNELYFVEVHCEGGMECPPYVNNRELACVVCSI